MGKGGKLKRLLEVQRSSVVSMRDPLLLCMRTHAPSPNVTCQGSRREYIISLLSRDDTCLLSFNLAVS